MANRVKRSFVHATIVSCVLALTAFAWAGEECGGGKGPANESHGKPCGGFLSEHADRLGLDDQTRTKVDRIIDDSREQGRHYEDKIGAAHGALKKLLAKPDVDEKAVMKQAERIGELEVEARKARLRAMLEIRSLMTTEQRKELIKIKKEMYARYAEKLEAACGADLKELCPEAEDLMTKKRCLSAEHHRLSPDCKEEVSSKFYGHRGPR